MIRLLTLFVSLLTITSCSTLVGNVKPVDEKSTTYGVLDLTRENPALWTRLDVTQLRPPDGKTGSNKKASSSEETDVAYQSKKTSAIISLNSSCRDGRSSIADLHPYLHELLLGMSEISEHSEEARQVSGVDAVEGIAAGTMAGEATKIDAVVLAKDGCIYDLMYISRPDRFSAHETDFKRFVSSLRLR